MNDLISRQAAIDLFPNDSLEWDTYRGYIAPHLARRMIEELPSAQPEIIRCKDCKHWDPEDKKCDCGHDIIWQLPRHADWYCADAERKEE